MIVEHAVRRPALTAGAVGPVLFMALTGPLNPDDIDAMRACHRRMTQHKRSAVFTLCHRIAMPDAATRARAVDVMQEVAPDTIRVIALLTGGLWASAARSVLTGLYMLSGRQHLHTVVTDVNAGFALVASGLGLPVSTVEESYATFRAFAAPRPETAAGQGPG